MSDKTSEQYAVMNEIAEVQWTELRSCLKFQRQNALIPNLVIINAIIHVAETGCKWHTFYTRMRCWTDACVLGLLFVALQGHRRIHVQVECFGLD